MKPTDPYAQREWVYWLATALKITEAEARQLMAAAEADMADAGQVEVTYADIAQLAADRGIIYPQRGTK